jgi:hypothetical protein
MLKFILLHISNISIAYFMSRPSCPPGISSRITNCDISNYVIFVSTVTLHLS